MAVVPAVTPVTTSPPLSETFALSAAHVPPETASAREIAEPTHTLEEPDIVPASELFTVIVVVAKAPPQPLTLYDIVAVPAEIPFIEAIAGYVVDNTVIDEL